MARLLYWKNDYRLSLQSINLATELMHSEKYYLFKIQLLFKMKLWNQLNEFFQHLDNLAGYNQNIQLNNVSFSHYRQLLMKKLASFTDSRKFSSENTLAEDDLFEFEFDINCRIQYETKKGYHLKCIGSNIPYGTYIIKERVISAVFYPNYLQRKCFWCYRNLDRIRYACRKCNQVSFCDRICERKAFRNGFHRFECTLIPILIVNGHSWHAFRLITFIGLDKMVEFFRQKKCQINSNENEFSRMTFDCDEFVQNVQLLNQFKLDEIDGQIDHNIYQWKLLLLIDCLIEHRPGRRNVNAINDQVFSALKIIIMAILVEKERANNQMSIFNCNNDVLDENLMISLLITLANGTSRLINKLSFNLFGWSEPDSSDLNRFNVIGSCFCLASSLINHSCNANAYFDIFDGIIHIATCR